MAQQQQQMMQPQQQPRGMMMPMYAGGMIPMSTGPVMMMPGHAATMPIMPSQQSKSSSMQRVHKKVVTEEVVHKSKKSYNCMHNINCNHVLHTKVYYKTAYKHQYAPVTVIYFVFCRETQQVLDFKMFIQEHYIKVYCSVLFKNTFLEIF